MSVQRGNRTYPLRHPIVLETRPAGGELNEEELKPAGHTVVIRRPKAKHMRTFDKHDRNAIGAMIELLSHVTTLDLLEVENLDAEDFEELGNLAVPERRSGQTTGPTA